MWKILQVLVHLGGFLVRNRLKYESENSQYSEVDPMVVLKNHTTQILNRPFKGMKYPKLLGSYEYEIQFQLNELKKIITLK